MEKKWSSYKARHFSFSFWSNLLHLVIHIKLGSLYSWNKKVGIQSENNQDIILVFEEENEASVLAEDSTAILKDITFVLQNNSKLS